MSELIIDLGYGGEESIRKDNSKLYTYEGASPELGPHNVYSHVWIEEKDDEEEVISVAYVFKDHDEFNMIANHMKKHNFEQHLYLPKPYPIDVIAFEAVHKIIDGQLTIPEDWEQPLDSRGDN